MLVRLKKQGSRMLWAYRYQKHMLLHQNLPGVFCNSIQKSGTQWLIKAVEGIQGIRHYQRDAFNHVLSRSHLNTALNTTSEHALARIQRLLPGEMMGGHVEYHPELETYFATANVCHCFIIRDPRDVVVSLYNWWLKHPEPKLWPYTVFKALTSRDERLSFLIEGKSYLKRNNLSEKDATFPWPDIVQRYQVFLPWLRSDHTLVLHFESLKTDPEKQYKKLFQWIKGASPLSYQLKAICQKADPAFSSTYHQSHVGQWRHYFSQQHYEAFQSLGGLSLLETLRNPIQK